MVVAKHCDRVSGTPCFPGKIHRKSPQLVVNYYGDRKLLRRSLLSTAGLPKTLTNQWGKPVSSVISEDFLVLAPREGPESSEEKDPH